MQPVITHHPLKLLIMKWFPLKYSAIGSLTIIYLQASLITSVSQASNNPVPEFINRSADKSWKTLIGQVTDPEKQIKFQQVAHYFEFDSIQYLRRGFRSGYLEAAMHQKGHDKRTQIPKYLQGTTTASKKRHAWSLGYRLGTSFAQKDGIAQVVPREGSQAKKSKPKRSFWNILRLPFGRGSRHKHPVSEKDNHRHSHKSPSPILHSNHDHSSHANHDHSSHANHDHSSHANHDHSSHANHDHGSHANHGNSRSETALPEIKTLPPSLDEIDFHQPEPNVESSLPVIFQPPSKQESTDILTDNTLSPGPSLHITLETEVNQLKERMSAANQELERLHNQETAFQKMVDGLKSPSLNQSIDNSALSDQIDTLRRHNEILQNQLNDMADDQIPIVPRSDDQLHDRVQQMEDDLERIRKRLVPPGSPTSHEDLIAHTVTDEIPVPVMQTEISSPLPSTQESDTVLWKPSRSLIVPSSYEVQDSGTPRRDEKIGRSWVQTSESELVPLQKPPSSPFSSTQIPTPLKIATSEENIAGPINEPNHSNQNLENGLFETQPPAATSIELNRPSNTPVLDPSRRLQTFGSPDNTASLNTGSAVLPQDNICQVGLLGSVQQPGNYQLENKFRTIGILLQKAGGLHPGSTGKLCIIRIEGISGHTHSLEPVVVRADLYDRTRRERVLNTPLKHGDLIVLEGKSDIVYLANLPSWVGEVPLHDSISPPVKQFLQDQTGHLELTGQTLFGWVIRMDSQGHMIIKGFPQSFVLKPYRELIEPKLMPGDIVYFGTYASTTTQETISLVPALGIHTETLNQP